MGVFSQDWAVQVFLEAMKFWLYSLIFSLAFGLLQLYQLSNTPPSFPADVKGTMVKDERIVPNNQSKAQSLKVQRQNIIRKIFVDGCDLLIPGSGTGWLPVPPPITGMASIVSTGITSMDIWERVQKTP